MTTAGSRPAPPPEVLLEGFRSTGHPRDLAALFDATAPDLFRLALHLVPDAATAEDVLQETFLAVLEHAREYEPGRPALPWMNGILRNQAGIARRREARRPDPDRLPDRPSPADPAALAADGEERERLHGALLRLPEPYRGVALLRWRYGLEPAAIAEVRGEPPGTVRSLLHRAMKRLKSEMVALPALLLAFREERGIELVRSAVLRRAEASSAAAAGAGAAAVVGGTLMGLKAGTGIVAVAAALGIGWWMLRDGGAAGAAGTPPAPPPSLEEPPPPAPPGTPPDLRPPTVKGGEDPPPSRAFSSSLATARLRVRTLLEGTPPRMRPVKFSADPSCGEQHSTEVLEESVVAHDGLLSNAVVYVSRGAERWTFVPPEAPVVLDQKGCMYLPHVFTAMTGQGIRIRNSDPVMHNVHAVPKVNREFNRSQLKETADIEERFGKPELGIKIKCDVHGWMASFASVFDHPFHGVTDGEGVAELPLPPGEYEVSVWHEKLKSPAARMVRVAGGETADLEFLFGAN